MASENTSTEEMNMSNPTAGGGMGFSNPLAPAEGYEYDFSSFNGDSEAPGTPFDRLIGLPGIDNLGDIFGDLDPEDNPFGGGNPTEGGTGGAGDMDDMGEGSETPVDSGDDTPMPVEPDGGIGDGAGPIGNDNPFGGGNSQGGAGGFGGGNSFAGGNIDTGEDNENSGSGNSTFGDANSTSGNGNTNFGSNNQTEGNGNRSFGEDGEGLNEVFEGGENPLEAGESDVPIDLEEIGGNIPVFAGGGTPAFEGETPDLEDLEESSDNETSGNGNWNFGSSNETSGNGNWNFGSDSTIEGNGNWNLGDNNEITGSGNRPSGSGNTINGNGNRPTGSNNTINGNRVSTSEDNVDIYGNGDRYFQTDSDGNTTLVSDESASDPNYTYDFSGVVGSDSADNADVDFSSVIDQFPSDSDSDETAEDISQISDAPEEDEVDDTDSEPSSTDSPTNEMLEESDEDDVMGEDDGSALLEQLRMSPFGRLLDIEGVDGVEDIFGNLGGGDNSFGGVGNGNPFANWNPQTDGNPLIEGDQPNLDSDQGDGYWLSEVEIDGITGELSSSIDNFVESVEARLDNLINSGGEGLDEGAVIAEIGDEYLLNDGSGGWYISSDETFDSDDLLVFDGSPSNNLPYFEAVNVFMNSMAENLDNSTFISFIGE
ncbi:MAG: hypothetical protein KA714_08495 [Limnoraphis sp. WC205]|jgi:hypothetical protein|nr:hypothetical protein [Limnoraphis sp. WC205]